MRTWARSSMKSTVFCQHSLPLLLNVIDVAIFQGRQANYQEDKSWLFPCITFYIPPFQREALNQLRTTFLFNNLLPYPSRTK
jgi:hypothetical protein